MNVTIVRIQLDKHRSDGHMDMDEKRIRDILISFLKVRHDKIRIYQEKNIGKSICDLMAVTDCLMGFEIKSDLDNYSRLETQITQYNSFFNLNYIVVGEKHEKSANYKVPDNWGIIVICYDDVRIVREAKKNKDFEPFLQLMTLWKLELNNILNYFNLPLFSQKSKDFIAKTICDKVPIDQLERQIAYELRNRDYSVYGAKDYTEYYEKGNLSFADNLIDDVSEMEQMTLDQWIEIYSQAQKVRQAKEVVIKEKSVRKKHAITYEDIEVYPGAPWISKEIISEFARYLVSMDHGGKKFYNGCQFIKVNYEPITGNWFIEQKQFANGIVSSTVKYGLPNYNALHILEATLNLREIRLSKKNSTEVDEESTLAAIEKQKQIIEFFKEWVWQDEDRIWEIEENYNNMFGDYHKERFDGSKLEFPDMDVKFELYDYQKDAVQRIISEKNTLLAFDVGAGKTFIMIAAAMIMRQRGISRKNMFVVPNNIVGQWQKIFTDLYPHAKLLVIDPKSFKAPVREKAMQQMKYGDYDGIIIAYSCFEMIPISIEYVTNEMQKKIAEIEEAVKGMHYEAGSTVALENEKRNIRKLTEQLIKSMDFRYVETSFDDLEITTLFVDEAHNYKNVPIRTRMKYLRGINISGSKKCLDMLQKVRYVQNSDFGKGVVFATGTPLCNSLADAYTLQMYLQYDDMRKRHFDVFDNWVKTFTKPEKVVEVDVDSQHYRYVNKFTKFYNLPELSRMFSDVAFFYAVNVSDGLPKKCDYNDCLIERNHALMKYMKTLAERAERIRGKCSKDGKTEKIGRVDPKEDNMLKISTDGRKAALDLRLVQKEQPLETSKVNECIKNVKNIYDSYAGCSQLVFCDYSTPKKDDFNVYASIKEGLIEQGIPKDEIAFVHSFKTEERKLALYQKVNEGTVRVLLGSTFKLGIGANVQTKLKAIHHLDVPWRPADMVQREGRIIRRGNENEEILIYRYICEGSFDAYSWQILEAKQRFISQFLMGSAYQRCEADLEEEVLSYAEVKALALSDPAMKELAEKENELANLRIICGKQYETTLNLKEQICKLENENIELEKRIKGTELNIKEISHHGENDYKSLKSALSEMLKPKLISINNNRIGRAWGFIFTTPEKQSDKKKILIITRNNTSYILETGDSAVGNAQRVINFLKGFEEYLGKMKTRVEDNKDKISRMNNQMTEENPYKVQAYELEQEVKRLRNKIEKYQESTNRVP